MSGQVTIPDDIENKAKAFFAQENPYKTIGEQKDRLYSISGFDKSFQSSGHSVGMLALVTLMQFAESLMDFQATDAVANRIDWKFVLAPPYTGFETKTLDEFRGRLKDDKSDESKLLTALLEDFRRTGLLPHRIVADTTIGGVLNEIQTVNNRGKPNYKKILLEWWKSLTTKPAEWWKNYGAWTLAIGLGGILIFIFNTLLEQVSNPDPTTFHPTLLNFSPDTEDLATFLAPLLLLATAIERIWETIFDIYERFAVAIASRLGIATEETSKLQGELTTAEEALKGATGTEDLKVKLKAVRTARLALLDIYASPEYKGVKRAITTVGCLIVGVMVCLWQRIGIFEAIGFGDIPPITNIVLTGLLIGAGSGPLHFFILNLQELRNALAGLANDAQSKALNRFNVDEEEEDQENEEDEDEQQNRRFAVVGEMTQQAGSSKPTVVRGGLGPSTVVIPPTTVVVPLSVKPRKGASASGSMTKDWLDPDTQREIRDLLRRK
jgi:hypothetical protein